MKKLNLIALSLMVTATSVFAGGLVTNTNQSAAWARTLTRDASLGVDAVYFNPAGLVQLDNGLHLSISNQSIWQTRTIVSENPAFNSAPESVYEAELTAPLYPSIYASYNLDKWAFSAGFNIIGGGGSADFKAGLPSIETGMLFLSPLTNSVLAGVDAAAGTHFAETYGYDMNSAFSGSSMYLGFQLGAAYAINDMISVALGGRYVSAKNTYTGSLDGMIHGSDAYGGTLQYAGDYIRWAAGQVGMGDNPQLNGAAAMLDGVSKNVKLDAVQTGGGFTPIIGVNLHLSDKVNIAARYEFHTKIELTNATTSDLPDDQAMFPDGEKSRADLPGMFAIGAQVKPLEKLSIGLSFNYFLDKGAYYGNMDANDEQINNESTIDENGLTLAASLEYKVLGILGVSAGYSYSNLGVNDSYQTDLSYANSSSTIGAGVFVELGEMITLNAGYVYVMYNDYNKTINTPPVPEFQEIYGKKTNIFAIGIDFNF
jgi:long-chain fatty acid transport protein